MVSPSSRRRAVKHILAEGLGSASQACRTVGLARSSYYRKERRKSESCVIENRIIALSQNKPRYGYRFITAKLREEGFRVNRKRVQRVRSRERLQVAQKQRRTRRLGISTARRQRADHANHVWSWDIIHDQLENGIKLKMLTLIDESTKQSLSIRVGRSIRATDAIKVIEAAIEQYGRPEHIRSDNGSEFIAHAIRDWMNENEIKTIYIKPGSPWEQPFIESFHDKFRDECLNRELFGSLAEAKVIVAQWRAEYNEQRPHSALGYLSPDKFAAAHNNTMTERQSQKYNPLASEAVGPNARLIHNRLFPAPCAAATSRTCARHSRSTRVRGDYE